MGDTTETPSALTPPTRTWSPSVNPTPLTTRGSPPNSARCRRDLLNLHLRRYRNALSSACLPSSDHLTSTHPGAPVGESARMAAPRTPIPLPVNSNRHWIRPRVDIRQRYTGSPAGPDEARLPESEGARWSAHGAPGLAPPVPRPTFPPEFPRRPKALPAAPVPGPHRDTPLAGTPQTEQHGKQNWKTSEHVTPLNLSMTIPISRVNGVVNRGGCA